MTKKDYVAIAAIIVEHKNDRYRPAHTIALALAGYFATDNARFDRARFLRACGIEE